MSSLDLYDIDNYMAKAKLLLETMFFVINLLNVFLIKIPSKHST